MLDAHGRYLYDTSSFQGLKKSSNPEVKVRITSNDATLWYLKRKSCAASAPPLTCKTMAHAPLIDHQIEFGGSHEEADVPLNKARPFHRQT